MGRARDVAWRLSEPDAPVAGAQQAKPRSAAAVGLLCPTKARLLLHERVDGEGPNEP